MKWFVGFIMILLGIALGSAAAYFRDSDPGIDYRKLFTIADRAPKSGSVVPAASLAANQPRLTVENGREYEFGVMEVNERLQHTFMVRNDGDVPLTLELIRTTCKCAIGELPAGAIAPGEVGEVTLDWIAKDYQREFRQSATIETNDPSNQMLILSIFGRVVQSVIVYPEVLTLGDSTANDDRTATLSLHAYKDPALEIESYDWIASDFAEYLDVDWEPAESRDGAMCAYNVNVRLKSGMPHGQFKETLLLKLSSTPDRIEIPVSGRIVSDISIVGRSFSERTGVLRLGVVPKDRGATAGLLLLVKGPHREQVEFSKAQTDPEHGLDVTIGEPTVWDTVVKYPIEIIVPPGSDLVQRLNSEQNPGKILLDTTHPTIKQIELQVSYAVIE